MILKLLLPLLLVIAMTLVMWKTSAWRLTASLNQRASPLREPKISAYADRMARELGLQQVSVKVFDDPGLNGLAAPGGGIYITRGFVEKYRRGEVSAEEIASVIAHELGHVDLGHARRRMVDFTGLTAARFATIAILGRFIPVIGWWIGMLLAGLAATAIGAGLSRKDEFEADAFAAALLTRIGIGAEPQMSLLRKLGHGHAHGQTPSWMMSHPRPDQRVAAIAEFARRWRDVDKGTDEDGNKGGGGGPRPLA
jgi:putative metalloprotease